MGSGMGFVSPLVSPARKLAPEERLPSKNATGSLNLRGCVSIPGFNVPRKVMVPPLLGAVFLELAGMG
jgi:hypothetical protein